MEILPFIMGFIICQICQLAFRFWSHMREVKQNNDLNRQGEELWTDVSHKARELIKVRDKNQQPGEEIRQPSVDLVRMAMLHPEDARCLVQPPESSDQGLVKVRCLDCNGY